ncbi:MAG: trypsin-like peptidase domain-containing protein [Gordonia sp. (in: high G+C Gram-positive bacteria)]
MPPRGVPVSPQTAAVFGRPAGVTGSFSTVPSERPQPQLAPPDPVLAEAFGRPAGAASSLERDPHADYGRTEPESDVADPWRDPASAAQLAAPALSESKKTSAAAPGPKLGLGDLLFGRRVTWWALASLAIVAILIGVAGGLVGRYTAEAVPPLNSENVKLNIDDSQAASSPIAKIAQGVAPAIVMIEVRTPAGGGTGSGFVVSKDGYIVTNNHVISMAAQDKSAKLEVVFADHQRVPARIAGRDTKTDLAVLKVDDVEGLKVSALGDSSRLEIGQTVIAFGAPLGLDRTVTTGIVSAVDRPVPLRPDAVSDTDAVLNAIQTDAAINPGNSGGPLVDAKGRVIGVNTAVAGSGSNGLGFAIPIDEVKPIMKGLISDGKVSHPQIGVSASTVRNDRVFGAKVESVSPGGPAARAGLKLKDVITEFGGKPVEGANELTVAVRMSKVGKDVKFKYWRDGRVFSGTIKPAAD